MFIATKSIVSFDADFSPNEVKPHPEGNHGVKLTQNLVEIIEYEDCPSELTMPTPILNN